MSKKPADTKAATPTADAEAAPKKRSKAKLALAALVPLVLAAGGYAGWTFFMAPAATEAHAEAPQGGQGEAVQNAQAEAGHGGEDPMKVSSISTEVLAETSATHTYALSVLIAGTCGASKAPALKAASEAEALENGTLVNLSWMGAARRAKALTDKACGYMLGEIESAERALAAPVAPAKGGHGEAKPAH